MGTDLIASIDAAPLPASRFPFQCVLKPRDHVVAAQLLWDMVDLCSEASWGGLQLLLVELLSQPQLLHACFLYPKSNFPQLFGMARHQEVGVLLSQRRASVCVQWVPKRPQMRAVRVQNLPAAPYKHLELLFCATTHISSNFGHVLNSSCSAVAAALLCSWRCTGHL